MEIRRPVRATRTYTQKIAADPYKVFPLLCPVREAEWIEGWDPRLVVSESGVAERDCVFITEGSGAEAVWYVTRHDQAQGFIEMVKVTPKVTACRLMIQLAPAEEGCTATITYSHTSLGPDGDELVRSFTDEFYERFMKEWEAQLNHYLETGAALPERGSS